MEPKNGERTTYPSGALRSDRTGRGRYDLISPHGLKRLAIQYEEGAIQKGANNWKFGFPCSRACCSAIGHIMDRLAGDVSEDHYAAAVWQLFCAMHFEKEIEQGKLPVELNDVPFDANTLPLDTGVPLTKFYITKKTITHVHFKVIMSDGDAGDLCMAKDEFEPFVKALSGLVKVIYPETKATLTVAHAKPEPPLPNTNLPMSWEDWFAQEHDISSIQQTTGSWAEEHFPGMTNEAIWTHLQREVRELSYEFSPEEAADCFLILLHLAHKNNFNLLAEALRKYKINTERKWATKPDPDGVYLHIDKEKDDS